MDKDLKADINDIFHKVVNHDSCYWLANVYIRWRTVERDICAVIERHLTNQSSGRDKAQAQSDAYLEAEAKHHKLSDIEG